MRIAPADTRSSPQVPHQALASGLPSVTPSTHTNNCTQHRDRVPEQPVTYLQVCARCRPLGSGQACNPDPPCDASSCRRSRHSAKGEGKEEKRENSKRWGGSKMAAKKKPAKSPAKSPASKVCAPSLRHVRFRPPRSESAPSRPGRRASERERERDSKSAHAALNANRKHKP